MKILMYLGLMALFSVANAAPTPTGQPTENIGPNDIIGEVVDFIKRLLRVTEARIHETEPQVAEIWTQIRTGIQCMMDIAKGINDRELIEKIGDLSEIRRHVLESGIGKEIFDALADAVFGSLGLIFDFTHFDNENDRWLLMLEILDNLGFKLMMDLYDMTDIVDALNHVKYIVDSKIDAGKPSIRAALEKIKAVVDHMIRKAMEYFPFAIGFLGQIGERIVAKGFKVALEKLYIMVKANNESGEDKNNIVNFLRWLKSEFDWRIATTTHYYQLPAKMMSTQINVAMQDIIEKAETNIEGLLETIITKIEEQD